MKWFLIGCLCTILVMAFVGVQPLASYKDTIIDWGASWFMDVEAGMTTLHGTYRTESMFGEVSLTFRGNTVTGSSELFGSGVAEYFIPGDSLDSAQSIKLTDLSTGVIEWHKFRYVRSADCVIFDGITFCKE